MIRADRELLADLARVNSDVAVLALRVMDGSATAEEQQEMAGRLIDPGDRLRRRADDVPPVIEGQVFDGAQAIRRTVPNQEP